MKHVIKSKRRTGAQNILVIVELLPESTAEKTAIRNLQEGSIGDNERAMIEDYLHFNLELGDYSILNLIQNGQNIFTLNIFLG